MKSRGLALIVAMLAVASAEAGAQRDDQFVFGIGGGATFPSGLAKENHKLGGHGTVMFGIGGVDSPFGIRFDGFYSTLDDGDDVGLVVNQGAGRVFTLLGHAVLNLYGDNRRVYAVGGLGGFWYNPDGDSTVAENDLALSAGLGFWIPKINGFVEARWLNLYRALPDSDTGQQGKKSARLYPVTLGFMF